MPAFLASENMPARAETKFRRCVSAGEALPADVGKRWSEKYGCDILDGIGSTEMLHIFLSNAPGATKYGTTGKPVPGYELKLIDDHGQPVQAGRDGRIASSAGRPRAIMYWNNREQSRRTFMGEWTRSGDKYLQDEDGYYVYCGRNDDMLKVSGLYVSPFEVEGALQTHDDVLECAVVAWLDGDGLIKPKAFVVLKSQGKAGDDAGARPAGSRQGAARAVQISALDRIPHRPAENRDRQDPALQAAGGSARTEGSRRFNAAPKGAGAEPFRYRGTFQ